MNVELGTMDPKLSALLKERKCDFRWDSDTQTWCLFGIDHGNVWETDDYDAATLAQAEEDAIAYLETLIEQEQEPPTD